VLFPYKSLLRSVSSPQRRRQMYTACGTSHSKNFPTKILMYHNEGNMSRSIHLQSTYKNHHSVPIEYLSASYSSMARDISQFHGNANWQVKIWTTLESGRTQAFIEVCSTWQFSRLFTETTLQTLRPSLCSWSKETDGIRFLCTLT